MKIINKSSKKSKKKVKKYEAQEKIKRRNQGRNHISS